MLTSLPKTALEDLQGEDLVPSYLVRKINVLSHGFHEKMKLIHLGIYFQILLNNAVLFLSRDGNGPTQYPRKVSFTSLGYECGLIYLPIVVLMENILTH